MMVVRVVVIVEPSLLLLLSSSSKGQPPKLSSECRARYAGPFCASPATGPKSTGFGMSGQDATIGCRASDEEHPNEASAAMVGKTRIVASSPSFSNRSSGILSALQGGELPAEELPAESTM